MESLYIAMERVYLWLAHRFIELGAWFVDMGFNMTFRITRWEEEGSS